MLNKKMNKNKSMNNISKESAKISLIVPQKVFLKCLMKGLSFSLFVLIVGLTEITNAAILPNFSASYSTPNNQIDKNTRKKIHQINKILIESIINNNPRVMFEMFTDEAKKAGISKVKKIYEEINETIKKRKFHPFYDNLVNVAIKGEGLVSVPSETIDDFFIHLAIQNNSLLLPKNEKFFISLMTTEGQSMDNILTIVYQLVSNKWKLHIFHIGNIRILNKSAIEWYAEALEISEKGHYASALLMLKYAKEVLKPAPIIQYEKEQQVLDLTNNLSYKIQDQIKLPSSLPGKPRLMIYGIDGIIFKQKILPLVRFITETSFSNKQQTRKEAEHVARYIKKQVPGIFDYNEKVLLRAYNEAPISPQKKYKTFGIVISSSSIE